jgi:type II secretory pathway pseudopilin PulG
MIVVVIAGLLVMLAAPAYQKLRRNSAGKALVLDARNIGLAMQQIALEHPRATRPGAIFTISVSSDGTLASAGLGDGDDVIGPDSITQYVRKVSPGTGGPITYTFGAGSGEKAFSMSHLHCAPNDVAPSSTVNTSATLGASVQFDEEGKPL